MEIVIKIPDEDYEYLKRHNKSGMYSSILNGTPLPEGHGDLIDRKKLINDGINKGFCDWYDEIKSADTIIEADKREEE